MIPGSWVIMSSGRASSATACGEFEKYVLDTEEHMFMTPWWYRIIPYQSYVKGWRISPSHYLNQDLATVWLDK
jgi:peptide/nickel transport system substrate-binding protein